MTANPQQHDELRDLLGSLSEGSISADGISRIEELVSSDTDLLRLYIEHLRLFSDLRLGPTNQHVAETLAQVFAPMEQGLGTFVASEAPSTPLAIPTTVPAASTAARSPFFIDTSLPSTIPPPPYAFVDSMWFSYLLAAVIMSVGLLIASAWKMPDYAQMARQPAPTPAPVVPRPSPAPQFVGCITGMTDCQWADARTATLDRASVPIGRQYALAAGLMQITYDTGAKVILQGPCTYKVESADGGYLAVGKLTARVEKRGDGKGERGEIPATSTEYGVRSTEQVGTTAKQNSETSSPQSPATSPSSNPSLSTLHSPFFTIKTPTATITDLGTEFGVTVEPSGATETHVFQGRVQARRLGRGSEAQGMIELDANQSARIDVEVGPEPAIRLTTVNPEMFIRKLTKRVPIELFNTGVGLRAGDPDPHWQLVAQSNEAHFSPRPAIVVSAVPAWLADDADPSQWISALPGYSAVPDGVTYTFRTTFELVGVRPETARLTGWFIVDNHVRAIRLNGHDVAVPEHEYDYLPFDQYHRFTIGEGFVDGTNVLEIDVENGKSAEETDRSLMGLRAKLEATARSK